MLEDLDVVVIVIGSGPDGASAVHGLAPLGILLDETARSRGPAPASAAMPSTGSLSPKRRGGCAGHLRRSGAGLAFQPEAAHQRLRREVQGRRRRQERQ